MDALDRMYSLLVRVIRAHHPQYLTQPFEVAELYQTILPYRHYRRELALETNQDYEATLSLLLSGARGYLIVDDRMQEVLTREMASPAPDIEAFRQFADAHAALSPAALRSGAAGPEAAAIAEPSSGGAAAEQPPAPGDAAASRAVRSPTPPSAADPTRCRYCKGQLPTGRPVTFCPHCGQNLSVMNCAACGAELEVEWKFCVVCGRTTGREAGA
jgi:hypothetical protein